MPCNYPDDETCDPCDCELADVPTMRAYDFNPDPEWQAFVLTYERYIKKIAMKYCVSDEALREDTMQEARVGLATMTPSQCRDYEPFLRKEISEVQWKERLDRYCRNTIRNSILSYLDSYAKGNWYIGRTRSVKDKKTGAKRKVYLPPRFSSLDELVDAYGMQVDQDSNISWAAASEDGISDGHNGLSDGTNDPGKGRWILPVVEDIAE